jgi:hypothetical protein
LIRSEAALDDLEINERTAGVQPAVHFFWYIAWLLIHSDRKTMANFRLTRQGRYDILDPVKM